MNGHELTVWRKRHGWNQHDAADRLDVARRTYQRWEDRDDALPGVVKLACERIDTLVSMARPEPEPDGDVHLQLDWIGALTSQRARIVLTLREYGPLTRQELAEITGIPIKSVDGRVRALLDKHHLLDGDPVEPDNPRSRRTVLINPARL